MGRGSGREGKWGEGKEKLASSETIVGEGKN